jgi:cyclopropane-fatty-acyl-phospholipid synthase
MSLPDAKPPFSVSSIADRAWNLVAETAFRTSWTPIARLAETAVVACVVVLHVGGPDLNADNAAGLCRT